LPLSYYDLLEKPDWYQSFNGNANVTTQLPYTLKTGAGRVARQFVNDAPPGVGTHCMELQPSQQIECELITSLNDAYPRQVGQTAMGATYEFWIKIPSGFTITQDYKLLFRERNQSGNTVFDRIALTADYRIVVKGSNNGGNGNGYLMSSNTIQSDPLGFDTWHHISIVYADDTIFSSATALRGYANIFLYQNGILTQALEGFELGGVNQSSTTGGITSGNFYQYGWDASRGLIFNGEVANDGGHFAQWNTTTIPIKIAGFAMWHKTAQTQKQIARRYMYGLAAQKHRQKDLITASGPWFACDLNNVSWDGTNDNFQNQFGSNVASNGSWGTSLATGNVNNLTLKNPDSLESNGISATGTWLNNFSGQIAFDSTRAAALEALHMTGNFSFEAWVKWGLTRNNFKPNKQGTGPVMNMTSTVGGVTHVIRAAADGRMEFVDRFGDSFLTFSTNTGPLSQKLITDQDWVHLAATYANESGTVYCRFYINGRQFAQRVVTGNLNNPTWGTINGLNLLFAGSSTQAEPKTMDIFAIYDRPLSTSEVRQRYLNYAALDRNAAYWDGVKWKIPTANKYWDGTQWSFWNDKVKHYDGTNWVMV